MSLHSWLGGFTTVAPISRELRRPPGATNPRGRDMAIAARHKSANRYTDKLFPVGWVFLSQHGLRVVYSLVKHI